MKISGESQFTVPEGTIDLGIGQPSFSFLPEKLLKNAAESFFNKTNPGYLQYGLPRGNFKFRTLLADFIASHYGFNTDPQEFCVTAGASQALDMLCTKLAASGDTVYTEDPAYYLALDIFRDHRLNIEGIPVREEGLDLNYLEYKLKEKVPSFLYIIPAFQNPTGVTYNKENRKNLVRLCEEYGCRVIADEVYQLLYFNEAPPLSFAGYSETGLVFSLGSFSKIFGPGIRLGWIQGTSKVMTEFDSNGLLYSGGGMNPVMQGIMVEALKKDLVDEQLDFLKVKYSKNAAALSDSLVKYSASEISFHQPDGGFFIWGELNSSMNAEDLLQRGKKHGVAFHPGNRFSPGSNYGNYIRFSFSYYGQEDLAEGARRFGELLK